jgi:hypothetical protein
VPLNCKDSGVEAISAAEAGAPWLTVAGKRLRGWIVIDIDATVITSASDKMWTITRFFIAWMTQFALG